MWRKKGGLEAKMEDYQHPTSLLTGFGTIMEALTHAFADFINFAGGGLDWTHRHSQEGKPQEGGSKLRKCENHGQSTKGMSQHEKTPVFVVGIWHSNGTGIIMEVEDLDHP